MSKDMIVFDMDGVLVDVSESYRETIRKTVGHFTGRDIGKELIQDYKNSGGWNNDWALSQKIIGDLGKRLEYHVVVDYFQSIFFGTDSEGLIMREKWIAREGLLARLNERFGFAIFTGRQLAEADVTLRRFARDLHFETIVSDDDVVNPKPAPDGLNMISAKYPGRKLWYIGDTVDDARSAKSARVDFIGIAGRENPKRDELAALLKQEKAVAVLESINELETVL